MKGGKEGPVMVPGAPDQSNLFHRISLSPSDKDFMPKDGKTPLTPEQTAAIQVWIKAGAPKSGLVGAIKLADAHKAVLQKALPTGARRGSPTTTSRASPWSPSRSPCRRWPRPTARWSPRWRTRASSSGGWPRTATWST